LIWFGWTSKSCASSISVFLALAIGLDPMAPQWLAAATATFALNAGLWFRRGRLAMVFSSLAASCRHGAEKPLIPVAQIFGTTSLAEPSTSS
jgi:hypothetical protein